MKQSEVFQTVQRFVSTENFLCKLKSCELRDSTCSEKLESSYLFLDTSYNLKYSLATGYSE